MKVGEGCRPVMDDILPVKGLPEVDVQTVLIEVVQTVQHNHIVIARHNLEKFYQIINLFQLQNHGVSQRFEITIK